MFCYSYVVFLWLVEFFLLFFLFTEELLYGYGFGIRRGDVGVHHNFQDVPREGVDILSKLRHIQVDVYSLFILCYIVYITHSDIHGI